MVSGRNGKRIVTGHVVIDLPKTALSSTEQHNASSAGKLFLSRDFISWVVVLQQVGIRIDRAGLTRDFS